MKKRTPRILICCCFLGSSIALAGVESGAACGGTDGTKCSAPDDYCSLGVGTCKAPDAAGQCKPKPGLCTMDFTPVCGCDGTTYSNACGAASAGVSIEHLGECKQ